MMKAKVVTQWLADGGRLLWSTYKSITGADAYERYLRHHQATHPDCAPMGERDFWRQHYAAAENKPGARCC